MTRKWNPVTSQTLKLETLSVTLYRSLPRGGSVTQLLFSLGRAQCQVFPGSFKLYMKLHFWYWFGYTSMFYWASFYLYVCNFYFSVKSIGYFCLKQYTLKILKWLMTCSSLDFSSKNNTFARAISHLCRYLSTFTRTLLNICLCLFCKFSTEKNAERCSWPSKRLLSHLGRHFALTVTVQALWPAALPC